MRNVIASVAAVIFCSAACVQAHIPVDIPVVNGNMEAMNPIVWDGSKFLLEGAYIGGSKVASLVASAVYATQQAHSGNQSLEILLSGVDPNNPKTGDVALFLGPIDISAYGYGTYTFTFFVKTSTQPTQSKPFWIVANPKDASGQAINRDNVLTVMDNGGTQNTSGIASGFVKQSLSFVIQKNSAGGNDAKQLVLSVQMAKEDNTYWLDNFRLTYTQPADPRPAWAGMWGAWGSENYSASWLKGSLLSVSWKLIEPSDGVFNFSALESKINSAVQRGQYFLPKVYVENCPEWLFGKGVPMVYLDYGGNQDPHQPDYFPYYVNETYKVHLQRMWNAFQQFILSLPAEKREKCIGFQVPLGRSGDEQPYPAPVVDPQYDLPWQGAGSAAWTGYQVDMASRFVDLLKTNGLYNSDFYPIFNFTDAAESLALAQGLLHNIKPTAVGQAYQLNNEMNLDAQRQTLNMQQPDGSGHVRGRAEFDNVVKNQSGWLLSAPKWHYYWQCQWMLTYGLDLFMQRTQTILTGDSHKTAFDYFNERAGYKDPKTARYAHVALRDALDIQDVNRFPVSKFGSSNANRFSNIVAAMAPYGARQDDPASQNISVTFTFLNAISAMNDAGINIWRGNYGRYLNQIEPNVYDQGYWRVGSTNDPYGRFARGFDVANGKNTLYFDLDDQFFGAATSTAKQVKLKVIYYGEDTGSWVMKYHAADGTMKTALVVDNPVALGRWVEKGVVLTDALLNNGGAKGADLILQNTGATNCRFHLIELDRETEDKSSDASLSTLMVNGISVSGFSPNITNYTITMPYGSAVPAVFALPSNAFAEISISNAADVPGSTVVTTTAEDGAARAYTLNFLTPTSYAAFSNQYALVEGPLGDKDGDGISNLAEFGLGGNPANPADRGYSPVWEPAGGMMELIHVQRPGAVYRLEQSDCLVSNRWINAAYTITGSGPITNDLNVVTNRIDPADSNQRFIRLRIEQE